MPYLHIFTIADDAVDVPNLGHKMRHHVVIPWESAEWLRNPENLVAMYKLAGAAGCGGGFMTTPMLQAARECFSLRRGSYANCDGGPWAVITPDQIKTREQFHDFIAPLCRWSRVERWRRAEALAKELARLMNHVN